MGTGNSFDWEDRLYWDDSPLKFVDDDRYEKNDTNTEKVTDTGDTSKKKFFSKYDFLVLGVLLVCLAISIVLISIYGTEGELVAEVRVRGRIYQKILLSQVSEPYELHIEGKEDVVIYVSSESVRFVSSGCSDKLCVNTGELIRSGQSAVCLPARVSVKLVSYIENLDKLPDAVAG